MLTLILSCFRQTLKLVLSSNNQHGMKKTIPIMQFRYLLFTTKGKEVHQVLVQQTEYFTAGHLPLDKGNLFIFN